MPTVYLKVKTSHVFVTTYASISLNFRDAMKTVFRDECI